MPEEKKRTFDDDDLFQRKPYAEFLKNLILNCGNYHRDDDAKAYTIALDSPWGTGKSVFLEKFESMLEQDCQDQLCVVHYNAWENDFWDNAFEPFADAVFSHPLFASPLADQTTNRSVEKFGTAMKHLAVAFTKKQLENYFDSEHLSEAGSALAGAVGTYVSSDPNAVSPAYSAYKKNLKEMQAAMETVLQESIPDGKLVIIIDELDRCRPTFAIETLEIMKHVMDVPNVVYLFALDVQQLGAAIKKVYGAETDSTAYLMRFFSYYSRLPEADIELLLQSSMSDIREIQSFDGLEHDLSIIAKVMNFNARDIETVSKVYRIMIDTFLHEYHCAVAYKLYWALLCAKYKNPSQFHNEMNGIFDETTSKGVMFLGRSSSKVNLTVPLKILREDKTLEYQKFNIFKDGARIDSAKWTIVGTKIMGDDSIAILVTDELLGSPMSAFAKSISVAPNETISGLLYFPDLFRWDEIKTLTPGQFLLQQMEMFNFLPDIH